MSWRNVSSLHRIYCLHNLSCFYCVNGRFSRRAYCFYRVMNAGHIFIGLAGPVLMAAPPLVSAVWFPPHQRTTSTAYLSATAYLGIAVSFLIGPLIVTDLNTENSTSWVSAFVSFQALKYHQAKHCQSIRTGGSAFIIVFTVTS